MCMNVSEICAEGIFVTFPWWLENVKSRSKIALFSNECHFEIWFPKKRTITFFWRKLSKLHKKDQILHVATTFFLKQGETRTSHGPIPHPLNVLYHSALETKVYITLCYTQGWRHSRFLGHCHEKKKKKKNTLYFFHTSPKDSDEKNCHQRPVLFLRDLIFFFFFFLIHPKTPNLPEFKKFGPKWPLFLWLCQDFVTEWHTIFCVTCRRGTKRPLVWQRNMYNTFKLKYGCLPRCYTWRLKQCWMGIDPSNCTIMHYSEFKGIGHDFCWSGKPIYQLQKQVNIHIFQNK